VLQAGVRLNDRYLLEQRLRAGGMGEVLPAADEVLHRTVAVKAMLPGRRHNRLLRADPGRTRPHHHRPCGEFAQPAGGP
jgi:hypothetical protein